MTAEEVISNLVFIIIGGFGTSLFLFVTLRMLTSNKDDGDDLK